MSHDQPGDRHRHRPAILLLAPVLAGSLALTAIASAQAAAPASGTANGTTNGAKTGHTAGSEADEQHYSAGTYLIELAEEPVASYAGGAQGLKATKPPQGKRLTVGTEPVRAYKEHLERQREGVLTGVPDIKPLYTYDIVLNGFAAELTAAEANRLARTPGVVSLTRNEVIRPARAAVAGNDRAATSADASTRTPAGTLPAPDTAKFLGLKDKDGLYGKFPRGQRGAGEGMILGVVDYGIDTDNPSVRALPEPRSDAEVIAKKWKGRCDPGEDTAHQVRCNNKVIGAQYFNKGLTDPTADDWASPMDNDSHGTHTATTAAGNMDVDAVVPDSGISSRISGVAPAARIAAYKACWSNGCSTVDTVAAIDKAVADGVDVINYSLGGDPRVLSGALETAMRHAAEAGVFISAAGGNSGPGTVSNELPWITTAGASTHDTGYRTTVTLGDGTSYTGVGISASAVPSAPLVDAARAARGGVAAADAELCLPDTLDPDKATGAIVLCKRGGNTRVDKSEQVKAAGGAGMVVYNPGAPDDVLADAHRVPSVHLNTVDGQAVKAYTERAGSRATARLDAARTVRQRAPEVWALSSGGPDAISGGDLLKPDLIAPGVDIVAGVAQGSPDFKGKQNIMTGTSMAAPHIAGLALLLRSLHPDWSPAEVKSALMTTATTADSDGKPIQRSGADATPLNYGAGQVVPNAAADPGLVYNSTSADWTAYICAIEGRLVDENGDDVCAAVAETDPSDLNYPTISVGDLVGSQTITRTVTNVAPTPGDYTVTTTAPRGFKAEASPKRLVVAPGASATYQVTFTRTDAAYGQWSYGRVDLTDIGARHTVRSTVALRATQFSVPAKTTGTGTAGSVTLSPETGWYGTLTTRVDGPYTGEPRTGTLTGATPDLAPTDPPAEFPPATDRTAITAPEGCRFARVGILSADHVDGSDVERWVRGEAGGEAASWPPLGKDEYIGPGPGTYVVQLDQYSLPRDITSQTYALGTWGMGDITRRSCLAVADPATRQVTGRATAKIPVRWKDLSPTESTSVVGPLE
ncbi:S8 family serine peptidase [Streptomyces sp. NPDC057623]|uniref:S8 family serine peptidase n=1 Tax=Streptomyces sp. NPDC057623 TaxID=3346187 RepID=UPI0036BEBBA1